MSAENKKTPGRKLSKLADLKNRARDAQKVRVEANKAVRISSNSLIRTVIDTRGGLKK